MTLQEQVYGLLNHLGHDPHDVKNIEITTFTIYVTTYVRDNNGKILYNHDTRQPRVHTFDHRWRDEDVQEAS